jgi:methylphosphotriester-DNA--protein-cysteine methyltransferase
VILKGTDFHVRLTETSQSRSISFPEAEIAPTSVALFGRDLTPSRDCSSVQVSPTAVARLRRLHAQVNRLAETAPKVIENPRVAERVEAALSEAVLSALAEGRVREDRSAQRHHSKIVEKLHDLGQQYFGEPLYLTEICKKLGVTARTLHNSCREQLGMSPVRYLLLRRLHLAHQALTVASRGETSVTEIAMRFGFFEFGRFAQFYRSVFGETPSATLARPI